MTKLILIAVLLLCGCDKPIQVIQPTPKIDYNEFVQYTVDNNLTCASNHNIIDLVFTIENGYDRYYVLYEYKCSNGKNFIVKHKR